MSILEVRGVGKSYREYGSEWKRVARWFGLNLGKVTEHWVLRNIDFAISPGQAVGIVGQNGAGKSTLLKLITGTEQPTEGVVNVRGRVAAILELGMGFNPEFTGRKNAAHAAGLMGFSQAEIEQAMPHIEAFAEIGEYFDEPMRSYSSGMQMRVAFAVATAYRPEILIVDEALSVGDAYFQHKSFARIREFQEQGTTLLIVSHDRGAIQSLCNRAILLENGNIIKDGNPEEVFDFYNAIIADKEQATVNVKTLENGKTQTTSGTGEATVSSILMTDMAGNPVEFANVGQRVRLQMEVYVRTPIERLILGYAIKDRLGQVVYGTNTDLKKLPLTMVRKGERYLFDIAFDANLGPGSYSVSTGLTSSDTHLVNNYEWRDLALVFSVINEKNEHFEGVVWMDPDINVGVLSGPEARGHG